MKRLAWLLVVPLLLVGGVTVKRGPANDVESSSFSDADSDGLFDRAILWDADGDGSSFVTCTASTAPDTACKAVGERVYRDTVDDINCAVHGCGHGQMERDGTLILGMGVYVGWACWDAANPTRNSNDTMETNGNDDQHDSVGDASFADCATDADGNFLTAISLQDWQGTLRGSGADRRKLERGSMGASLRRDRGTYLVNDMGPWKDTTDTNTWFGNADNQRFLSAGFHPQFGVNTHVGASSAAGDSKGWWKTFATADLDQNYAGTQTVCLRQSGGVVGTDYATVNTVDDLRPGDTLLIPVKSQSVATIYAIYELRVRESPTTVCGVGNAGLYVSGGGSIAANSSSYRTYPAYAGEILLADGREAGHARSNFRNTRVTIKNLTLSPQDPWNEFGGRCTNSGVVWRTLITDIGTGFTLATDDTNTDFSCDTMSLVGFWGGGSIRLTDVVISEFHQFAVDGGSSGGIHVADNVTFLYGNGGAIADTGNGWQLRHTLVSDSHFTANVISVFSPGLIVDDFEVRNSVFDNITSLSNYNEGTVWTNVRNVSNGHNHSFRLLCGSRWNTFRDIYVTGRGLFFPSGFPTTFLFDCDNTASPIEQNLVENVTVDPPDAAVGATEQASLVMFKADAATNASYEEFAAIRGNTFRNFHAIGVGAVAVESGCLYGVLEMDADAPPDDDGESSVFVFNFFDGGAIQADGFVFCMTNTAPDIEQIDSEGAATPAWGDPVGCGNFDGTVVFADENCG